VVVAIWAWFVQANSIQLVASDRAQPATELRLLELDGQPVSLESLRGSVVLVSLWASWCPPCRTEVPRLNRLAARLGPRGLKVLAVNVEQFDSAELRRLRDQLGIEYTVLTPLSAFEGAFDWDGSLPYAWLIDRQGRLRAEHAGLPVERSLRRACERLLDEPA
jgi:thiol-disulfide isomerase/thioredoxin